MGRKVEGQDEENSVFFFFFLKIKSYRNGRGFCEEVFNERTQSK